MFRFKKYIFTTWGSFTLILCMFVAAAANGEMDKPVKFDGNLFLNYPNLVTR